METVEDLCREKLSTCSNLYGGGPDGLAALVNTMRDIVDQKIVAECQSLLTEFGNNLCAVQSTDTVHSYPYTCRVYAPGDQQYATNSACNNANANIAGCGDDYVNSLYHRFVNYAMQVCIRPSKYEVLNNNVPTLVLQDINIVMDKMRISMSQELSRECERLGGIWITNPYNEETDSDIKLYEQFYTETGTNKKWGYCKTIETEKPTYTITLTSNPCENGELNCKSSSYTVIATYGDDMPAVSKPTYTGSVTKTFKGYFTGQNGTGTKYYDADGKSVRQCDFSSNTTLYAHWQSN